MQIDHKPTKLVIVGASGTGKTTLLCGYLYGADATRVFVFDHQGELAARLSQPSLLSLAAVFSAVEKGEKWIVYDPCDEYPGALDFAFETFCALIFDVCRAEDGRKLLVVDDLQEVADAKNLPEGFRKIWQTGRRAGLDCVLISHGMNETSSKVRNGITEVIAFANVDKRALEFLDALGFDAEVIRALPSGEYRGRNIRYGGQYKGNVFQ